MPDTRSVRVGDTLNRELLATCWTSAGNVLPTSVDTRSPVSIRDRVESISATGFSALGLYHSDLDVIRATMGLAAFSELVSDHGLQLRELELLVDWYLTGEDEVANEAAQDELFSSAAELGVPVIKAAPHLAGLFVPRDAMIEQFDRLAAKGSHYGVRVALEPMPWSNVPTLADAVELVTAAGNPNGGLAVDSWHLAKGGTAHCDIARILPLDKVFLVELADGILDSELSLSDDAIYERLPPGDGELDTAGFVVAMHDLGYRAHWGVEIMSNKHRALPPVDALAWTFDSTQRTLDIAERQLTEAASNSPRGSGYFDK